MKMVKLTKQEIRDRLRYAQLTIGTSRANFFAEDIPERKMRYIVAIFIFGDATATRLVEIEKLKDGHADPPVAADYDMIFDNIGVAPTEKIQLPKDKYDIEDPIITLEGGANLAAVADAGAPEATVIYWDSIEA